MSQIMTENTEKTFETNELYDVLRAHCEPFVQAPEMLNIQPVWSMAASFSPTKGLSNHPELSTEDLCALKEKGVSNPDKGMIIHPMTENSTIDFSLLEKWLNDKGVLTKQCFTHIGERTVVGLFVDGDTAKTYLSALLDMPAPTVDFATAFEKLRKAGEEKSNVQGK